MTIPATNELSAAAATIIAFGHCGKIAPGLPNPQIRIGLDQLLALIRRAESVTTGIDGYGPGHNPDDARGRNYTADGKPDSTVANLAVALADDQVHDHDDVHALAQAAAHDLIDAGRALRAFAHKLELARDLATPRKPTGHTEPICAEPTCTEPAAPGREGRCRADYQWRWQYRHDHPGEVPPPVPEHTIAARQERTDRRRQHVTGPLADAS